MIGCIYTLVFDRNSTHVESKLEMEDSSTAFILGVSQIVFSNSGSPQRLIVRQDEGWKGHRQRERRGRQRYQHKQQQQRRRKRGNSSSAQERP